MPDGTLKFSRSLLPMPVAYQELSVGGAAVGLTVPVGCHATRVKFVVGPVCYTLDGTTPTSVLGMVGYDSDERMLSLGESLSAKFIRQGGVNGLVQATYYLHP